MSATEVQGRDDSHSQIPPSIPVSAERELFVRCREGDSQAREDLILRFVPLAQRLAQRYRRSGEPADDLVQVASIGLIKAIDRYDVERGIAFAAFATPTILGELKHHFRDLTWAVRVPHTLSSLILRVDKERAMLCERLRREPSISELAAVLDMSDVAVLEALVARGAYRALSFNAPSSTSSGRDPTTTLADAVGVDEDGFEQAEQRATLARLLPALDRSERDVLRMRFAHDMTQSQIAGRLGVSQMQISRVICHAIAELRAASDGHCGAQSAYAA